MRIIVDKNKETNEVTFLIWFRCSKDDYFTWYRRIKRFFEKWEAK